MLYVGIDPGQFQSGYVVTEEYRPTQHGKVDNLMLRNLLIASFCSEDSRLIIEQPVGRKWSGASISETAYWAGVFASAWHDFPAVILKNRQSVRMNTVGKSATDSKIRDYLVERFDPDNFESIKYKKGGQAGQHKYYMDRGSDFFDGFTDDVWQAYALVVVHLDGRGK